MAAAQAKAELGENQQAAVQAPERREQRAPLVEIARQNSDQLMACIEQIEGRHENVAQQRRIDPVNKP